MRQWFGGKRRWELQRFMMGNVSQQTTNPLKRLEKQAELARIRMLEREQIAWSTQFTDSICLEKKAEAFFMQLLLEKPMAFQRRKCVV